MDKAEPRVVDFLDELKQQLLDDEERWGLHTWLCNCDGQNKYHIVRFVTYYLESEKNGTLPPWLKVAGGALICWIKENHPEILEDTDCYDPGVTPALVDETEVDADVDGISQEVRAERIRQIKLWGTEFDAKNTANDWAAYLINYISKATYVRRDEKYTPESFRANMLKVAALAQAAVLIIDRNGCCAPRHYENLPKAGANEIEGE